MMESKERAMKIAKLLDERKAIDVQVIDIALKSSFADYFVMASGGSERQMAALVEACSQRVWKELAALAGSSWITAMLSST